MNFEWDRVFLIIDSLIGIALIVWLTRRHRDAIRQRSNTFADRMQIVASHGTTLQAVVAEDLSFSWVTGGEHLRLGKAGDRSKGSLVQLLHPQDSAELVEWLGQPAPDPGADERWTRAAVRLLGTDGRWLEHDLTLVDCRTMPDLGDFALSATDVSQLAEATKGRDLAVLTDALTELPNRLALVEELAAIDRESSSATERTLVVLAVRNLTSVNATFGMSTGDDTIRTVASHVRAVTGEADHCFRIGGGTFAVLFSGRSDAALVAVQALLDRLAAPVPTRSGDVRVEVLAGLAHADPYETAVRGLFSDASRALTAARESGGRRLVVFDSALRDQTRARAARRDLLVRAVTNRKLFVELRPMVDPRGREWGQIAEPTLQVGDDQSVSGRELLVEAEQFGISLHQDYLELALTRHHRAGPVAIMVAEEALVRPSMAMSALEVVARHGVACSNVLLLVSESAVQDPRSRAVLRTLRNLGFGLVLDGFGERIGSAVVLNEGVVDWIRIPARLLDGSAGSLQVLVTAAREAGVRVMTSDPRADQLDELAALGIERFDGVDDRRSSPVSLVPSGSGRERIALNG